MPANRTLPHLSPYGPAAGAFSEILKKAGAIRWFAASHRDPVPFIYEHLETIGMKDRFLVEEVSGSLSLVQDFADEEWKDACDKVGETGRTMVQESEYLKRLIAPTLWIFPGTMSVCGVTFVAHDEVLRINLGLTPSAPEWRTAWTLVCEAEGVIWNALIWELVRLKHALPNPFLPLLDLYESGWFPLGFRNGRFSVFRNEG